MEKDNSRPLFWTLIHIVPIDPVDDSVLVVELGIDLLHPGTELRHEPCVLHFESLVSERGISPNKSTNEHCQCREQTQNDFESSFHRSLFIWKEGSSPDDAQDQRAFDDALLDRMLLLVGGLRHLFGDIGVHFIHGEDAVLQFIALGADLVGAACR